MSILKLGLGLAILAFALGDAKPLENEESMGFEITRITSTLLAKDLIPKEDLKDLVKLFQRTSKGKDDVVVNEYIDPLLVKLNKKIVMSGLDPTQLEDQGFDWEFKWLLITYSAEMTLKNGWMQGLATLKRVKDATLNSDGEFMHLTLPLTFTDLVFTYDYKAKLMGIGPKGGVDGKIRDSKFTITIKIDIITLQAELESYKLNKAGKISIKLTGNVLVDWMINMFTSVVVTFLTPVLKIFVSDWVFYYVNVILALYNETICTVVGACF